MKRTWRSERRRVLLAIIANRHNRPASLEALLPDFRAAWLRAGLPADALEELTREVWAEAPG